MSALSLCTGCPPPDADSFPDLVYVSTSGGASMLMAFDLEARSGRVLESAGTAAQAPAFLDAQTVITSSDGGLARLTLTDDAVTPIDLGGLEGTGPVVDGATVLFAGLEPVADDAIANQDVYRVDLAGGTPARLTDDDAFDTPAGTVGDDVVFVSNRGGAFDLWTMDATGSAQTPLVVDSGLFGRPAVSRDGAQLCWERADALVVQEAAGGPVTLLGGGEPIVGSDPAFDADGRVFFRRFLPDFTAELFVFNPADGTTTQVTTDGAVASSPALAP